MDDRLYIEQLRSTIGDLIAAGKARLGFKTLWEIRARDAKELLARDKRPYISKLEGYASDD